MIADIAEEQLADDGTGEGDGGNIALCGRACVGFSVELLEDRIDLADDTMDGGWLVGALQLRCARGENLPVQIAVGE